MTTAATMFVICGPTINPITTKMPAKNMATMPTPTAVQVKARTNKMDLVDGTETFTQTIARSTTGGSLEKVTMMVPVQPTLPLANRHFSKTYA